MVSRKRIVRLAPTSVANVFGLMYALLGLLFAFGATVARMMGADFGKEPNGLMLVLFPFLYAVIGYIGGLLMAALYNLVAATLGGIVMELDDVDA